MEAFFSYIFLSIMIDVIDGHIWIPDTYPLSNILSDVM